MRRPMMAGNWKMNMTVAEALALARQIYQLVGDTSVVEQLLCPPSVCLHPLKAASDGMPFLLGAQNCHWQESGAFTGEISPTMLRGLADYVILGHSERRQLFGETDKTVNKKTHAVVANQLNPIVCVGESLEQNERGETSSTITTQVRAALDGLNGGQIQSLVIAYEPIWAIGTGRAATAQTAGDICGLVRAILREMYGAAVADTTRVLYGGSTKPDNIGAIMEQSDVDGALIGGASLEADSYAEMVKITAGVYGD
ncbi:MAG: triose-phosphate isomerase [Caldilineaceae bacterium SB0664_bin_27]|uniref:Triosephosphate isomerase n=1 Tax=Caldilineaceae bacterium SB0664_bin_27 TaxID=2605260 RepID=A0A6B0Z247_9CHLR|nr:triose-phosphate isomerase [Caldilineaceae bacterium SB0664_bin_27]